jgi:hypothetical protein
VKEKLRFGTDTRVQISFFAIVVDAKFGQLRHKVNQVEPTAVVPLMNSCLGNIVAAFGGSRADACDVKFGAA